MIAYGLGASAIHEWEFYALDNGNTLLVTKESMDGLLIKCFKPLMDKKLNDSLEQWLSILKIRAEHLYKRRYPRYIY